MFIRIFASTTTRWQRRSHTFYFNTQKSHFKVKEAARDAIRTRPAKFMRPSVQSDEQ